MSDFRDGTKSGSWDFSAYVRTYALYLDEQLEFRMHDRRRKHGLLGEDDEEEFIMRKRSSPVPTTPVRDMKIYHVFTRAQHLQQLLERFLACRPTGPAKTNRVVLASLYPIVKESFQIYSDATGVMNILIERFMELEVRDCMKVIDIFNRMSKQFDELETFYRWCKVTGLARSSEYPEVDRIEQKKLDMMDEVVRDKMALAQGKRVNKNVGLKTEGKSIEDKVPRATNGIRASPPPREYPEEKKEETKQDGIEKQNSTKEETHKLDPRDNEVKNEEQGNKLALALIDISTPRTTENATPEWVAFTSEDTSYWETSFVHSSSTSDNQKAKPGGGFNGLPLEAVYQQSNSMTLREAWGATGSASSVALGSTGKQQAMLALPAPPVSGTGVPLGASDPFSASWSVSPPAYVQMSEIEQKQRMLVDEQLLWQQYARDGRRGHMGVQQYQNGMAGYSRMY